MRFTTILVASRDPACGLPLAGTLDEPAESMDWVYWPQYSIDPVDPEANSLDPEIGVTESEFW